MTSCNHVAPPYCPACLAKFDRWLDGTGFMRQQARWSLQAQAEWQARCGVDVEALAEAEWMAWMAT